MLIRVASWCYDHRRRVVMFWILGLVAVSMLASQFGGDFHAEYSAPGAESTRAFDLLKSRFPSRSGDTVDIVVEAPAGITDPAVKKRIDDFIADAMKVNGVVGAVRPDDEANGGQISRDGTIGFGSLQLNVLGEVYEIEDAKELVKLGEEADADGFRLELGGQVPAIADQSEPGSEGIGLGAAAIILLITFGSLLAVGLPLAVAIVSLGTAFGIIGLLENIVDVPDWAPAVAGMIGIGVGVDYALFIITRYRQGLREQLDPRDSALKAIATAGRAVMFAGCTVVISLLGMLLMRMPFTPGVAFTASLAVLVVMVASVTFLPALLGFTGVHIDRLRVPFLKPGGDTQHGFWFRWSRMVQRRPWPAAIAGLAVLLLLASPVLGLRLGFPDAGNNSDTTTARRAYDLLEKGFGKGRNGPLLVVADLRASGDTAASLDPLAEAVRKTPGIAFVSPTQANESGDTAIITVVPTTSPQEEATVDLIHELRDDVLPKALGKSDTELYVGGITAAAIDSNSTVQARLPLFIGAVVLLSFLLLLVVFRSILVAVKAAVMNLLSIGAAYGIVAYSVQGNWFGRLIGIPEEVPVPAFIPMMMFAILFGLSMDYEVFLLSRVREEYERTRDNGLAVADGLAATARVITAAAAIMVTVFGAFILEPDPFIKMIGIGLASAIFVDATIVRMVLVPATMELLGDANWWLPGWLARHLPDVHVEGTSVPSDVAAPVAAGG